MLSQQIMAEHPAPLVDEPILGEVINACYECAHTCLSCADACMAEQDIAALRGCMQMDWNCADVCHTTARLLARQTEANQGVLVAQVKCCREVCQACASTCASHRDQHRHCALCADNCSTCAETCRELLKAL